MSRQTTQTRRDDRSTVQWINADERLPDSSECDRLGYVLIAYGGEPTVRMAKWSESFGCWVDLANFKVHGVFAWAKLPAPPPCPSA